MGPALMASRAMGNVTAARVGRAQTVLNVCQGIMAKIAQSAHSPATPADLAVTA